MFGAALLVFEMSTPRQALRAAGCLTGMFAVRLREQRGAAIRVRGAERVWRQALQALASLGRRIRSIKRRGDAVAAG